MNKLLKNWRTVLVTLVVAVSLILLAKVSPVKIFTLATPSTTVSQEQQIASITDSHDIPMEFTSLPETLSTDSNQALAKALNDYIPYVMRKHGTPGLIMAVGRDGKMIYEAAFGYKDIVNQQPMTTDTTFFTGSMAKTYIAIAALQLVEQGVMDLNAPVNTYLNAFQISNPLGEREVTLYDLLTHRSGLSSNVGGGLTSDFDNVRSLEDVLAGVYSNEHEFNDTFHRSQLLTWSAKVGEKWQYSNTGTATIGYLVETMNPEGFDLETYMQRKVFEPLDMENTQHPPLITPENVRTDLWNKHSLGNQRFGPFLVSDKHKVGPEAPAGGIITTVADFIRVPMAYLNGGELDGGRILNPETVKASITSQIKIEAGYHQGLMWKLSGVDDGADFRFWHPGGAPYGHTNVFGGWPELGLSSVVHTNSWPITSSRYEDIHQVEDFLVRWIKEEQALGKLPEFRSWAWKTSYVMGILSAEAMNGFGSLKKAETTQAVIEQMAAGAIYQLARPGDKAPWDAEGFQAGVLDALPAEGELTVDSLRAFVTSGQMQVSQGDFMEIYKSLGGKASLIPSFFEA